VAPARNGRAVHVDPIKPTLKAPGTKSLKLNCILLSSFAFKFNLRRYETVALAAQLAHLDMAAVGAGNTAGAYTRPLFSST